MHCQDVLLSGPLCGHQGSCRISLLQQVRSRGGARSLCRRWLLPRAEGGEGGSSTPGLVSKPSLSRPPQRPAPAPEGQGRGTQAQDKPARQSSGGAYRRQDSFQEGSAGNGEAGKHISNSTASDFEVLWTAVGFRPLQGWDGDHCREPADSCTRR